MKPRTLTGFMLFELLVSMSLLASISTGILLLLLAGCREEKKAFDRLFLQNLVSSLLEEQAYVGTWREFSYSSSEYHISLTKKYPLENHAYLPLLVRAERGEVVCCFETACLYAP